MERHLKKVYDCLNIGCNKKAVQEVDRLPRNVKNLAVFKALKALALIRMQKRRQAFEIINEIDRNDDLDDVTLQTMTSCFKESFEVARIVDLYESALKRKPCDQDILVQLFMAYVRIFNFKRQKEIAILLHKNFPKKSRLYTFWAIMSLVMQSQELQNSTSTDHTVCLKLAEKMCERMIDDKATNEEIELYLTILRKQNKKEEEYRFLTGPICLRVTDHLSWFNRRRAFLCIDLKMYSRAFKHYFPTLIQDYPEQIEYYQGLIRSAFLLDTEISSQHQLTNEQQQAPAQTNQTGGTPVKSTSALAECFDIIEKQCSLTMDGGDNLKETQKSKGQTKHRASSLNSNRRRILRGPYMARTHLYNTILSQENVLPKNIYNLCRSQAQSKFPSPEAILLDYFQNFSKKLICYQDMNYMINDFNLSVTAKSTLVQSIEDWVRDLTKNRPDLSALDSFYIELNHRILKHSIHDYKPTDNVQDRLNLAKESIDFYIINKDVGKNLNKTEFQPVDTLCLLAINAIMTNSIDSSMQSSESILNDQIIVSLIALCENAVAYSPANHQLKLTLLKLYSFIGATKQSSKVLLLLDIKHFQIDTLGHLLNPVLYNTGDYSLSRDCLENCLDFYSHGIRECFEGLTQSYKDGRFSKIGEVGALLRRLSDSLNFVQCMLLRNIVAVVDAANVEDLNSVCRSFDPFKGMHRIFFDETAEIRDNRDFKVLKSLHSDTDQFVKESQPENFVEEKLWMTLRYYILYSLHLQQEHLSGHQSMNSELTCMQEKVKAVRLELKQAAAKPKSSMHSYFQPESPPFRWDHIDFNTLVDLVDPLIFVKEPSMMTSELSDDYATRLDEIVDNIDKQISKITSLVSMKLALSAMTVSIEFISLAITSLYFIAHMTVGLGGSGNKSSSSQQPAPAAKPKSISNQMISKTEAQLTRLSNMVKSIDPKATILDQVISLEPKIMLDKEHDETLTSVKESLAECYAKSLKEIENTCKRKIKLVRSDSYR